MKVLEKIIEEIRDNAKLGNMHWENIGIEKVEEIIRSHMNHNGDTEMAGWIPCSERLPNEIEFQETYCRNQYAAEFLVTIKGATRPTTLYFKNNSWFDEQRNYYKVVAWQPLPAPYKGEEEAG